MAPVYPRIEARREYEDRGKEVFLSAAWVNPRLEPGPWSDEITEIVG
jgi:hypothetical protein